MIWTILINITTHHPYDAVKIVCVYPERETREWEWMRWFPHVWNADKTKRLMACSVEGVRELLKEMNETIKMRRRTSDGKAHHPVLPFYFVLLADKTLVKESGESLVVDSPLFGMTVVHAYGEMGQLPEECETVIECGNPANYGALNSKQNGRISFHLDRVTSNLMDSFARNLAPIRLVSRDSAGTIPNYISFLQGYGVSRIEDLRVLERWHSNCPFQGIAAPIGIMENGEDFCFNIHEKGHGPHGIVAGATRWGKSETLTTWLLSVALNYHPHEVSFVLIDFKGDGLSGILMDLPHIAGVISNVDDISSIERNLRSLHGELIRRQRVFKETHLENIHKYQETCRNQANTGRRLEPMPYLIIVIDEFAELKNQFPDQMNEFISIARVGGSLGVYMVLATQSPGGIVAGQVSANSRFRICLKTSEAGESKEILGTHDAFKITTRGRAYIKVGNNEVYEQVQTFYSKAQYLPGSGSKKQATEILVVETDGTRNRPEIYDRTIGAKATDLSEGRAVSNYINEIALKNSISNARQVWTAPLPQQLSLSSLIIGKEAFRNGDWASRNTGLSIIMGSVDDPEGQCQYPLVLNFQDEGHVIIYGAPSAGKTVFLQTLLFSSSLLYTPEQVQFIVLDFGTWGMKIFEGLPHMLLVADANDADKVKKAEEYLIAELNSRKKRFAEQGVGTLEAYREVTGETIPSILIVIDNMASLYAMSTDLFDTLIDIAREGGGLGMYLAMSAGSPSGFMFRIAQYVKTFYALQLTDKADYRQLVGGNGRQEPSHFPGRGFMKGPLEFQTALCVDGNSEGERIKKLRSLCSEMKAAWKGVKTEVIRTMPKEIDPNLLSFDKERVQMGFDTETAAPVDFILHDMNGCIVSGLPKSGKSNVLGWIILALGKDKETQIYIYENDTALDSLCEGAKTTNDGSKFDVYLKDIAHEYDIRSELGASTPRIAVCIDDFAKFYEEISEESAVFLETIIRYGEEYGIYVYITGNMSDLASFHNWSVKAFENCLLNGNAIVLGGRLKDHEFLSSLHTGGDVVFAPHEGCIIHDGKVRVVKFALLQNLRGEQNA